VKHCYKCSTDKELSEFNVNSSRKDGLQTQCRDCSKRNNNSNYLTNPKKRKAIRDRNKQVKSYNKELVNRYKRMCGCYVCGEKEPVALDLHHKDPSIKEDHPARMSRYSTKAFKAEIRKCMVLCSNCHRKFHAGLILL